MSLRYRWSALGSVSLLLLGTIAVTSRAQSMISRADSQAIGQVLLAENAHDTTSQALRAALSSDNARLSVIAKRALWRMRDPRFVARDSLPKLASPPVYAEPAWRLRFRAITAKSDCATIAGALADSAWAVRLHAADLLTAPCAADAKTAATLVSWVDALPVDASARTAGNVSWHAAAHAIVALARLDPFAASPRMKRMTLHSQWEARLYAVRAAAVLADTGALRSATRDADDNVREAAIDGLSKLTAHASDDVYLAALHSNGAQAVRAAANALKGSPRSDVKDSLNASLAFWTAKHVASQRDVRVALLAAAGRAATEDQPPPRRDDLSPETIPLALGKEVLLRVAMSPSSGGGAFVVRLRGDIAPIMAGRVLEMVRAHYYDYGIWHRVEPDFVIQGAGPGSNEYVGATQYLRDETGNVPHLRGTVGMSTRSHDTGDAQWFVNLKDNLILGRDYTVFAEVVSGIEVVDGILEGDVVQAMTEVRNGAR